jgi:sulfate-transporting ATPase
MAFLAGWVHPGSHRLTGAAADAVARFDLHDVLDVEISELPQGTRRLVAVARAVAARPTVLCLDEPAAGLGEAERDAMARAIRLLVRRMHIGVVIIEHNIDVVAGLCDEMIVMEFGRVISSGSPAEVLASDVVREAYLGVSGEAHRSAATAEETAVVDERLVAARVEQ